jgi:hypothetical protein
MDYKGISCGFTKANADTKVRLKTTAFDAGIQGYKTLEQVEAGLNYGKDMTGMISIKYNYGGSFTSTPGVTLNNKGIFTRKATGREFKIQLEGDYDSTKELQLSSLSCEVTKAEW